MTALAPLDGTAGPLTWLPHALQQAWFGDKVSPQTREAYLRDGWHWLAWCRERGLDPLDATPGMARAWIDDQRTGAWFPPLVRRRGTGPDAEATIARRVSSLSRLYQVLRGEGVTQVDPLANVTRPQNPEPDDARILGLDARSARRLLAAADAHSPRMSALMWLLVTLGLRISEAITAEIESVTMVRGHRAITVTGKGRKRRTVAVPADTWHRIETYLAGRESGRIFLADHGRGPWDRISAWKAVRRLGLKTGDPKLHPHKLRHTSITFALDSGEQLDTVADMAGHANPRTTMRYRRARNQVEKSAAYGVARLIASTPLTDEPEEQE